jgi:hypothetical protein
MSSREGRRQQKTPGGACPREEVVKPRGTAGGPSSSPARGGAAPRGDQSSGLNAILFFVKLGEPPDADPHVRWCERTGASRPLLLDAYNTILVGRSSGGASVHRTLLYLLQSPQGGW